MHTRPNTEKALARNLLARSVGFFLPQYEKRWTNRGRRYCSHLPLFPGYLFVFGDEDARRTALETNLIANCLTDHDQPRLRDDLRRVFRLMTSDTPLSPEPRLGPGDPVEIIAGAMAGLQGRILRCGKNLKFTVEIRFLNQGVSVQVEDWMIRPIPGHAIDQSRRQRAPAAL